MGDEQRPKVLLILEHSENPTVQVGVVKDCHGSMPMDMSACDVVGTWSRFGEGTFYARLTTPVEALQDILIQLISKRTKEIEKMIQAARITPRVLARPPAPATAAPSHTLVDLEDLRAKLRGLRK